MRVVERAVKVERLGLVRARGRAARNPTATDRAAAPGPARRGGCRRRARTATDRPNTCRASARPTSASTPSMPCSARVQRSACSDEKQMPSAPMSTPLPSMRRNLSLAVTAATATPACDISASSVVAAHHLRVGHHDLGAAVAVEREIARDAVHRRRRAGDDRDIVRVGEGRHRRVGERVEPGLAPPRDRRQHPGREPRLEIGRVAAIGADHHGRPRRAAVAAAVERNRSHRALRAWGCERTCCRVAAINASRSALRPRPAYA